MLHVKLGLAKNLIKALKNHKPVFFHLKKILPGLSEVKLNEGLLNGPHMRTILKDCNFKSTLNQNVKRAWKVFEAVSTGFLGNAKNPEYKKIIKELLIVYKTLGCNMSLKINFLASHLDFFHPIWELSVMNKVNDFIKTLPLWRKDIKENLR